MNAELSTLFSHHASISSICLTYCMEIEPIPMAVLGCNCDIKAAVGADSSSQFPGMCPGSVLAVRLGEITVYTLVSSHPRNLSWFLLEGILSTWS